MDVFQALADPSRRRVIAALRIGERQVNDIVAELDIHQSGVSRHLRLLLAAGFVSVRPEGQLRLYSLRREPFEDMGGWLADYLEIWEGRLKRFDAALAAKKTERRQKSEKRRSGS
ncbi:MAG TPA: metalloregulator ArsR/SmtB family transcription factor [Steroidobacteraceae bacterium]